MENEQLATAIRDIQKAQYNYAERLHQTAVLMERLTLRLESQEKDAKDLSDTVNQLHSAFFGMDGTNLRLDRIEQRYLRSQQIQNWILGGGIVAFVSGLTMLYRALESLAQIEVAR